MDDRAVIVKRAPLQATSPDLVQWRDQDSAAGLDNTLMSLLWRLTAQPVVISTNSTANKSACEPATLATRY